MNHAECGRTCVDRRHGCVENSTPSWRRTHETWGVSFLLHHISLPSCKKCNSPPLLTFLAFPCLVTNSWTVYLVAVSCAAEHNTETALLEEIFVVVVGVAHSPGACVSFREVTIPRGVDETTVAIWPRLKCGYLRRLECEREVCY